MPDYNGYKDYGFVADYYDDVDLYLTRTDVKFFVDLAKKLNGEVLELGCGTGRVLIPTAEAGIVITGLDFSEHMLRRCREKLEPLPDSTRNRVSLVQGDMSDFSLNKKFKLITTPFRPFQHLTMVEQQKSCFACVKEHLEPDGRFVLDLFNPAIPYLANEDRKKEFDTGEEPHVRPDGTIIRRSARIVDFDYINQINDTELIYYVTDPQGNTERLVHRFYMRYMFRFEAEYLLNLCGFEVENIYSSYDKKPYGEIYPGELIFVCKHAI